MAKCSPMKFGTIQNYQNQIGIVQICAKQNTMIEITNLNYA